MRCSLRFFGTVLLLASLAGCLGGPQPDPPLTGRDRDAAFATDAATHSDAGFDTTSPLADAGLADARRDGGVDAATDGPPLDGPSANDAELDGPSPDGASPAHPDAPESDAPSTDAIVSAPDDLDAAGGSHG